MKTASNSRVPRTIPLVLIVGLLCSSAYGKVIYVDDDGQADFDTIQAGIDAAVDGDTVLVAPGEYVITEPITFRGKAITVISEAGRDETTIRMGTPADTHRGSVVVFENNETDASILDGFTITRGIGCRLWIPGQGPYESEFKWIGGGIRLDNASSATVRNCAIVQNRADAGGGVLAWSGARLILTNCIIRGNSAEGTIGLTGGGGGVLCTFDSSMTMSYCTIEENYAAQVGGGVYSGIDNSSVTMTHCVIVGNTSGKWAGGLACVWSGASMAIRNCTIWGNSAAINGGGLGCYQGTSATVTNSIFWGNTSPKGREIYLQQAPTEFSVAYSNVAGGQAVISVEGGSKLDWGEGNITDDPLFADPNNNDYHLMSQAGRWHPNSQTWVQDEVASPCIDAGNMASPIGHEPFPNGGFVNMGAYGGTAEASKSYFGEPVCETIVAGDINGDCKVDLADFAFMAFHWLQDSRP